MALLKDLQSLLTLEEKRLRQARMSALEALRLEALREYYPKTALRLRDELHMGTLSFDDLLEQAMVQIAPHDVAQHEDQSEISGPEF